MGQEHVDAGTKPAGTNAEKLNQILKDNQFISIELRDKFVADAMTPTSDSLGQRLLTVTKDAVKQVPQAFVDSLDPKNILPNVAIGSGFGAAMKLGLPESGPVGKAAGAAIGAWFVGKPLVESYYMAATANTNIDMYNASHHLADSVGGMPVAIVEGAVGAKLGMMAAGKVMGSTMAQPLAAWKAKQYEKLDTRISSAEVALKNAASRKIGVGNTVSREGNLSTDQGKPSSNRGQSDFSKTKPLELNYEHVSDVHGLLFERHLADVQRGVKPAADWLGGKDAINLYRGGAVRDMKGPHLEPISRSEFAAENFILGHDRKTFVETSRGDNAYFDLPLRESLPPNVPSLAELRARTASQSHVGRDNSPKSKDGSDK